MIILEPNHIAVLTANCVSSRAAQGNGERDPDHVPVVKFFNPVGAATWLATELLEDGDTLFGLADLGFGCPELGYFSLREITEIRLPFGLRIERDIGFDAMVPLSEWAEAARGAGSIIHAQALIRHLTRSQSGPPKAEQSTS
ncbi:DUF2958 domain-containing protein [Sphingobium cupriresistens]|uniref:Single-stranded DNA endonuclease n=1 Tax=Sphingobium cupriresistens LL01 TaxID=1420583 RepID=A0A0J7Y498_9SPHN|nr:DUF2958 domain-containing protein [Sphingobium cupriresistens]KMS58243.1 hypothetical protein V473_08915 [Sphingobium cupriresistens LL01]